MERRRKPTRKTSGDEVTGDPEEMRALGESVSGTQPEIGHKDTGIGRSVKEPGRRRGG